jgi:hypothetical protein
MMRWYGQTKSRRETCDRDELSTFRVPDRLIDGDSRREDHLYHGPEKGREIGHDDGVCFWGGDKDKSMWVV